MEFWNDHERIETLDAHKLHPPRITMQIYSAVTDCLNVTFESNVGKEYSVLLVYDGKLLQLVSVKITVDFMPKCQELIWGCIS